MKYSLNKDVICPYDDLAISKSLAILNLQARSFPESLAVQCVSTIASTLLSSGYMNKAIYIINQLLQYLSEVKDSCDTYRVELLTFLANIHRDNGRLSQSLDMYRKADDESKSIHTIDGCLFIKTKAWLYDEYIANFRISILKNLFPGYYTLEEDPDRQHHNDNYIYVLRSLNRRWRGLNSSRVIDTITTLRCIMPAVNTCRLDYDTGCERWRQQDYEEGARQLLQGLSRQDLINCHYDELDIYFPNVIYSFRRPPEALVLLVEVLTGFGDVYKLSPLFQHSLHKSKEFWIEYKEFIQEPPPDNFEAFWHRDFVRINMLGVAPESDYPRRGNYKLFEISPTISTDYGAVNIDGKVKRYPLTGVDDYLAFHRVLNQHRRLPRNYWFTQQHIHLHFLDILDALMYEYDPPEKEINFSISTPADKSLTSTAWKRENHKKRSRRQFHWNIPRHG